MELVWTIVPTGASFKPSEACIKEGNRMCLFYYTQCSDWPLSEAPNAQLFCEEIDLNDMML